MLLFCCLHLKNKPLYVSNNLLVRKYSLIFSRKQGHFYCVMFLWFLRQQGLRSIDCSYCIIINVIFFLMYYLEVLLLLLLFLRVVLKTLFFLLVCETNCIICCSDIQLPVLFFLTLLYLPKFAWCQKDVILINLTFDILHLYSINFLL